jgi:hypothetical protein
MSMLDILSVIPGKKRRTPNGWVSFNAVCCHHRGHKPDRRSRAGIIFDENTWSYSCFNCNFKCGNSPGKLFSSNTKRLLEWCGIDDAQIERWSFESYGMRGIIDAMQQQPKPFIANFDTKHLPEGSVPLDPSNPDHKIHVDYLASRGLSPTSHSYYVDSNDSARQRIIIPYYYDGRVVGNTSRFYDGRAPKYISDQQRGYVFNIDAQRSKSSVCILVEGQFDAISIGGCAYMGSTISDQQASLLNRLRKTMIVVPDHDSAGLSVCDRALELGYRVSIPEWEDDIKDVNDAVRRYGRLTTLLSILESATSSKIKIEMIRKRYK